MAHELDHYFENDLDSNNDLDLYFENDINSNITHSGIPNSHDVRLGGLDNIRIEKIPKIYLDSESDMSIDSTTNIHIKEIPEIRGHLPMNFNLGFKLFGIELFNFSLCGELQMITEKYKPTRWEHCIDSDTKK